MKNYLKSVTIVMLLLANISCLDPKPDTPEALLQHYVYLAFGGVEEKSLEQYLSPGFLQKIRDEQQLSTPPVRQLSFKNLKLKSYKLLNKECEKEITCQLRFEVGYEEINPETKQIEFLTETKKLAVLKLDENKTWKIDEIDHLRTSHEIKTPIEVPLKQ